MLVPAKERRTYTKTVPRNDGLDSELDGDDHKYQEWSTAGIPQSVNDNMRYIRDRDRPEMSV